VKVKWTERALSNLMAIGRFISRDKPTAARLGGQLKARAVTGDAPLAVIVPEIGQDNIREVIEGNYRIVYRLRDQEVHILTVFEVIASWTGTFQVLTTASRSGERHSHTYNQLSLRT
jgi:plasmid stabilization system protein ParE